jgi:hypothetical protein
MNINNTQKGDIVKKIWLGFNLVFIGSLVVAGLSGCYYRGHDEGYRNDRGHHDDNRDGDKHKGDHGDEHGDRDGH